MPSLPYTVLLVLPPGATQQASKCQRHVLACIVTVPLVVPSRGVVASIEHHWVRFGVVNGDGVLEVGHIEGGRLLSVKCSKLALLQNVASCLLDFPQFCRLKYSMCHTNQSTTYLRPLLSLPLHCIFPLLLHLMSSLQTWLLALDDRASTRKHLYGALGVVASMMPPTLLA